MSLAQSDSVLDALLPFLPDWQRARLAASDTRPPPSHAEGALLFADVSGFTPLAERLGREGVRGAERLSEVLNDVYGEMIGAVLDWGGDVWTIAGDAIFAVWPETESSDGARCAAHAALDMQKRASELPTALEHELKFRVSVAFGPLEVHDLGGDDRPLPLLAGAAVRAVVDADARCQPGEVVVGPLVWPHVRDDFSGAHIESGFVRIEKQVHCPEAPGRRPVPTLTTERVLPYLPEVVGARLGSGQAGFLGEFRTLSVLFMSLGAIGDQFDLEATTRATELIQQVVHRFDGTVYQVLRDDKGTVCIAAFGLPPHAHDDDAARAAEASVHLRQAFQRLGQPVAIGLATGRLFCGAYGHPQRRQYSVVGSTMNLAARLMQTCQGDGLLCDWYTQRAASRLAGFEESEARQLKGFARPVRTFVPLGRARVESRHAMVGREAELQSMVARLGALGHAGTGGMVLVRGRAGLGKSLLLQRVSRAARELDLHIEWGTAEAVEAGTSYYPLRGLVRGWLGQPTEVSTAYDALAEHPEAAELLPLLGPILGFVVPETAHTEQMTGAIRAENRRRALTLLARAFVTSPTLVVLEDAHWMDSATLSWLVEIARDLPVLWLFSSRPVDQPGPAYRALLEAVDEVLELAPLLPQDVAALVTNRLGVTRVPDEVVSLVQAKAEGNPFFAEELAVTLLERGLLEVDDGKVAIVGDLATELPDTVQGLITSRIDRLDAPQQLTLKVASVVGRSFEDRVLAMAHPVRGDRVEVPSHLHAAGRLDLVGPEEQSPEETVWAFSHAITHESTYELLLYAQRRDLHRLVAQALESLHEDDPAPVAARLAVHWEQADEPALAARAYAAAGIQAVEGYANEEAVDFLTRALNLARVVEVDDADRAEWLRTLGDARYALDLPTARDPYEQALEALGHARPGHTRTLLGDVWRNIRHRWLGPPRAANDDERRAAHIALRAAENLGPVYVWAGHDVPFAHLCFKAANLAHLAGPCGESAYAITQIGYLLAIVGLRGTAERDIETGRAMARDSGSDIHVVMSDVLGGMFYTMTGRADRAVDVLRAANELVGGVTAGLWHHRCRFMLGEAKLALGHFAHCEQLLDESAEIAEGAERHVVAFANAFGTLGTLRQGQVEAAAARLDGARGLHLLDDDADTPPITRFCSYGIAAETFARAGMLDRAREAAEECDRVAAATPKLDNYFAASWGHAGTVWAWLHLAEHDPSALADARRAHKRLGKLLHSYPGARPIHAVLAGRIAEASGRQGAALRAYRKAHALAASMHLPFELAEAATGAARLGDPSLTRALPDGVDR